MTRPTVPRTIKLRVPASTANLGAGFDCFALALNLFLTVKVTPLSGTSTRGSIQIRGVSGSARLPHAPHQNLILQAMKLCADREGFELPPAHLMVENAIPLASGLGSSAAAIAAGVMLAPSLVGRKISLNSALRYSAEIEGHSDNVCAALLGGLVVSCERPDGSIAAITKKWPAAIRILAVTPNFPLETVKARSALPATVSRADAVHNLRRSALFVAALQSRRHDLLRDAMQDRLHQPFRASLIPGLAEILKMPRMPGLLGIALSGAGPTVVALAERNCDQIGECIRKTFRSHGASATIRRLRAAETGAWESLRQSVV